MALCFSLFLFLLGPAILSIHGISPGRTRRIMYLQYNVMGSFFSYGDQRIRKLSQSHKNQEEDTE